MVCEGILTPEGKNSRIKTKNGPERPGAPVSELALLDPEWKARLTPSQYHVLREKGTEMPFSGKYDRHSEAGLYRCAACGNPLFSSDTKYDSHCGWPAFWGALDEKKVRLHEDRSLGMARTEVTCAKCGGHLGHVFGDGPRPTGKRFCINSESLEFVKKG